MKSYKGENEETDTKDLASEVYETYLARDLVKDFKNENIVVGDLEESLERYSNDKFSNLEDSVEFLSKFDTMTMLDLLTKLSNRYQDNNLVADWIENKIQLAQEISYYLLAEYFKVLK